MATGLKSWGEPTQSSGYLTLTRTSGTIYETSTGGQNTTEVITLTSVGIPNGTTVALDQTVWTSPDYSDPATPDVDFTVSSTVFTMNNNVGTITIAAIEDNVTEGQESIQVKIQQLDSNGVNTGAMSVFFKLIDTSLSVFDCDEAHGGVVQILDIGYVGDATTATPQNGTVVSINPSVYVSGSHTYTITISVPATGYENSGDEIECTNIYTALNYPIFDCSTANFAINAGGVGDVVTGTVSAGTIQSISPSTYQSGSGVHTYSANILVPSTGYFNSGATISGCTADRRSEFNCEEAGVIINPGFEGEIVTGSVANGTWLSVSPKLYIAGTNSYCVKVEPGLGYDNSNVPFIYCCQSLTVLAGGPTRDEYFISTGKSSPALFCNSSYQVTNSVWVEEGHSINTALNEYVYTTSTGNTKFNGAGRNYIVWPIPMTWNGTSQFTYWEISGIGQIDNVGIYNGCEIGGGGNGKL